MQERQRMKQSSRHCQTLVWVACDFDPTMPSTLSLHAPANQNPRPSAAQKRRAVIIGKEYRRLDTHHQVSTPTAVAPISPRPPVVCDVSRAAVSC